MINRWLSKIDGLTEMASRKTARTHSRRAFLSGVGTALIGVGAMTLLPVYRSNAFAAQTKSEEGDPASCEYWRHCAIDGYLCGCCGGTINTCPPGTVASDITWISITCRNPTNGKDYIISYNDCCGKTSCGRCICQRGQDETRRSIVRKPQTSLTGAQVASRTFPIRVPCPW